MCIVNNPGTWAKMFPPLKHAGWIGCTPTDLVFPFFVFCMGCAMAFSFRKYENAGSKPYWHVIKRGFLIFLVGFLLVLYPFYPTSLHDETWTFGQNYLYWLQHKRIFGVLQRIGISYIIAGCLVLWLRKPKKITIAIVALSVVYTAILLIFGREPGAFTLEGNVSVRIDEWLVGANHCYHGYDGTNFDPEGLLGSMSTACTALLGYLVGRMIISTSKEGAVTSDTVSRLFFDGCCCLAAGMVLSIWIPISKPLWTTSYMLYAGGWAMVVLAALSYVIDLKGVEKPFTPFKIMGMNALMAFICSGVIAKSYQFFNFSPSKVFGANEYTSLCFALIFAFVIFCIQWFLYRKKIVIRL